MNKFNDRFDTNADFALQPQYYLGLALFLLILPTNHTMALRMIFLITGLLAAWIMYRRHGMPPLPIRWPLMAWVGLAFISLSWSEMPAFSLGEIKSEIGYGMAAFFSFFILTLGSKTLRLWLHVAVASLALTLLLASGERWWWRPEDPELWKIVHGYASYSTYLTTVGSVLVLWLAFARARLRLAGFVLLAAYFLMAYLLGNRMHWLSLAAALAVFVALYAWRLHKRPREFARKVLPPLAGIVVCGVLFVMAASQKSVDYIRPQASSTTAEHLVETFTKSERLYMWAYWIERIKERPLTGVGFGRDLPHWVYEQPKDWHYLYFAHAHNIVLDYGVQLGIPGIAVLLWLFGAIAWRFFRYTRSRDENVFLVGTTGLALVIAFFSKNMADELFWRTDALVFWSFVGMLLGYGERALRHQEITPAVNQ